MQPASPCEIMNKKQNYFNQFIEWQNNKLSEKQRIIILSIIIGLAVGFAAVIIKNLVHFIRTYLEHTIVSHFTWIYIILPVIGIALAVVFIKYINRRPVRHGIPGVLYAISKNKGHMNRHNLYSSIITSALTVGFGGSVGLEGPTVATGGAIGSQIGQLFKLNQKQITLLLGCACSGAMAAIFKAPIAAIVFALEVIMLDLTMAAIVPLLISSATAALTSYFFLGQNVLYNFEIQESFELNQVVYYIGFGVLAGFASVYFTRVYNFISELFERINNTLFQLLIGGGSLGVLVFLFPSLYGEGYEIINDCLNGDYHNLFQGTLYQNLESSTLFTALFILITLLLKVVAASITFGAGGIGGIFAPTLFSGAILGIFFTFILQYFGIEISSSNFALVGMAGMISAVIHAPLTAIFLIAEITDGYELFMPLILVATISYATTKMFVNNSVYTIQLAKRGELITHHKDKAVLMLLDTKELIETDFSELHPDSKLGDLVETIKFAQRNVFPVVEKDKTFRGIVKLDDIRHLMFNTEIYDKVYVRDLMFMPQYVIESHEPMEDVAAKFQVSNRYNIAVLEHGKYKGFISRAKLFSAYRKLLKDFSEE